MPKQNDDGVVAVTKDSADISYDEMFPGRFLKAGEFKGKPVTLTIASVRKELPVASDDPDEEPPKPIFYLTFTETDREMAINTVTNRKCLAAMFGTERINKTWIGKRVTFHPENVKAFGETKPAIRVLGSPDLQGDITFMLMLARKKPKRITLKKTPDKNAKPQLANRAQAEAQVKAEQAAAANGMITAHASDGNPCKQCGAPAAKHTHADYGDGGRAEPPPMTLPGAAPVDDLPDDAQ